MFIAVLAVMAIGGFIGWVVSTLPSNWLLVPGGIAVAGITLGIGATLGSHFDKMPLLSIIFFLMSVTMVIVYSIILTGGL